MTKLLASTSRMISLFSGTLLVGVTICTSIAPAASASAPPPELAPLLQKTSELQISTERFSGEVALASKKLPPKLKALGGLKTKIAGELSTSPEAASITETVLGKAIVVHVIGHAIYIRDPAIAKLDGGRPWIMETEQSSAGALFGSNPSLGGGGSSSSGSGSSGSSGEASANHFASTIALLKESTDVRSLGASTVDGQAVTGFAGTVDAKKLAERQLPAKLRMQLGKMHLKLAAGYEVFLAANGLPVRTSIVLSLGPIKITALADVLAINFPVAAVPAPPAAETITAAEAKKLLLRRLTKKKK